MQSSLDSALPRRITPSNATEFAGESAYWFCPTAQFLDQCGMVTSSSSPTLLSTSHQNYYGTIDNRVLKSYGVNVSYKQSLSGYFLDAASGLFLPTILISNIM